MRLLSLAFSALLVVGLVACGGTGGDGGTQPILMASVSPSAVIVVPDGVSSSVTISVTRSSTLPLLITTAGVPQGVATLMDGISGNSPTIAFTVNSGTPVAAGSYPVSLNVSDGTSNATVSMTLTIGVLAKVATVTSQHSGMYLSTSFQPADWNYQYFQTDPASRQDTLDRLGARHINIQPMDGATESLKPGTYDFSKMDAVIQPILQVTDSSPLLQLYAPTWMWVNGDPSKGLVDPTFNQFADYGVALLKYYNSPAGFTDPISGTTYLSPSGKPIHWWGIFNEPNLTSLTPQQYVALYNLTAQKMLAVDPTIKLVGIELSDWGTEPQRYLPAFVQGVTQPVDAVATHYYGSCNQKDSDSQLVNAVPTFADHVAYFYSQLKTKPALANVPVWVTENNVNADWSNNGFSVCNPSQAFVGDPRGTSAFFAGWRPYVFSRLMKVDAQSLHHWSYNSDQQYGEVNGNTGETYLSYWTDYWLSQAMTDVDDPTQSGVDVLPVTATQGTPELLAIRKSDGTVWVMIANYSAAKSSDNNGTGASMTVVVDASTVGTFKSVSQIKIDRTTSATTGPTETQLPAANHVTVDMNGYSVAFLKFVP